MAHLSIHRFRTQLGLWTALIILLAVASFSLYDASPAYALNHTGGAITINDNTTASPYPSTINVQGEPGRITDLNVTLFDFTHAFPDDVDILLVSPGGIPIMLMSDACGSADMVDVDITFDDQAANALPDSSACSTGSYRPTNHVGGDGAESMPAPAGAPPYETQLASFGATTPNGIWSLYIRDDVGGQLGDIASWRLSITTETSIITMTNSAVAHEANPYPYNTEITARNGLITDVNVTMQMSHTHPEDLDILLQSPDGDTVVLMSDACGSDNFASDTFAFDQAAANVIPDADCNGTGGTFRPGNYGTGAADDHDNWGVAGAHSTSLNDFNNENPNGTWRLYVYDDSGGDTGFIRSVSINITTTNTSTLQIPSTAETDGAGTANLYPYNIVVAGHTGVVNDIQIDINGFTHSEPNDVDILLVSPNGIPVMLMSDACGLQPMTNINLEFNDEVGSSPAATIPDTGPCSSGVYRPGNWDGDESLPAPAPQAPYFDRMSAFDGINPNGTWQLYVNDDVTDNAGFIGGTITLGIVTQASMPNLIQNPNFTNGENNWLEFGSGSGSVAGGVYQFQRTSPTDAFTVFQTMTADFPQKTPFELRFDMGNSDADRKRITVLIWDASFGRQRACSFWLGAGQPMRTYQILGDVPDAATWTDVTVHFYAANMRTNADGYYLLDNVVMRQRDDLPTQGTEVYETLCVDPTAPNGDIGANTVNLLDNADFAVLPGGNANETWALTGNIAGNLSGGALRIQRTGTANDPAGSLLQDTNFTISNNHVLELLIDLGNSAGSWQRVTILLHNENFQGLQFCTFWLAPSAPLETYRIRTYANQDWNSQGVSVSVYPSTFSQWILVDNTILTRRTDTKVIGTGCYEPDSFQPAIDDAWMQEQLELLAQGQMLLPTATPFAAYSAPGAVGEMPILATPSAPIEQGAPAEGTVGE